MPSAVEALRQVVLFSFLSSLRYASNLAGAKRRPICLIKNFPVLRRVDAGLELVSKNRVQISASLSQRLVHGPYLRPFFDVIHFGPFPDLGVTMQPAEQKVGATLFDQPIAKLVEGICSHH
jgi:hypothetical protein